MIERSGLVALVGRPNVGKSTLVNRIVGTKVAITSDKPQTTRHRIMGVLTRPPTQVVFVDTPGIHKPRTALGHRLNDTAEAAIDDVDVVCFVVDATQPFGRGDRWIAERIPAGAICVLNKVDVANRAQVVAQLAEVGELGLAEYFPVSARTGEGVDALVEHLVAAMPDGPQYFPDDMVTDVPEAFMVAELVREQLLARTREELPHSIATRVTEWAWPYV
ncbi:MAG: GTPase Era, partial [Acidimicrobiia bacterium]